MRLTICLFAVFVGLLYVMLRGPQSTAQVDANVTGDFGEPISNWLSPTELFRFEQGRGAFNRRFTRAEGLGPHFNTTSCVACHEDPVPGGSGPRYRDFFLVAKTEVDGRTVKIPPDCTAVNADLAADELCLPSIVIPHYGPRGTIEDPVAAAVEHPSIPPEADVVARRNTPPLFGVGLFSWVTDEEILSRADPDDADADGISGRVNRVAAEDDAIGRFGYKCQTASIEGFTRGALMNQMGITSDSTELVFAADTSRWGRLFSLPEAHAQAAEPRDSNFDFDGKRDPEILPSTLINLVLFTESLAAPKRGPITAAVERGDAVFQRIGCATCHTPALETPRGCIRPYSDLLLHDMGPELADGIVMDRATGSEFRTQPLWGVCHHPPFLHDGRADTLESAILVHGGEAAAARDAYAALSGEEKADLHRFLESL